MNEQATTQTTTVEEIPVRLKRRSPLSELALRMLKTKPLGAAGGIIAILFFLTGIFADFLAPYGMNESQSGAFLSPPSAQYLLGTDNLGRDMLSRVIFGARISMTVGLVGTFVAISIATLIGITTGFIGGKLDLIVQRFVDAWMCFPLLIILVTIMSIAGTGLFQIVVVLGIAWGIGGSRTIRSAVMGIKENVYVEAAVAIGCPTWKVLVRHILPNIMAPIIIVATTGIPALILVEAALSFLGYGIPPPQPSWGGMLSGAGRDYMLMAPWIAIWPGLALSIVVYGINMFGDALRDLLDPRLRGSVGRYGNTKIKSRK